MQASPKTQSLDPRKFKRCFAGRGYSRSLFASLQAKLQRVANEFGDWPKLEGKGKNKTAYIPRLLLYIRHLQNTVAASNYLDEDNVLQYFHLFFLFDKKEQASFAWFGARRILETFVGRRAPSTISSNRSLQEQLGFPIYGYMGPGAQQTVEQLLGLVHMFTVTDVCANTERPPNANNTRTTRTTP